MSDYMDRVDVIDRLFYAATGVMAPGKDYPIGSHPPDDAERRAKFDEWMGHKAWRAALDHVVKLERKVTTLEEQLDDVIDAQQAARGGQ